MILFAVMERRASSHSSSLLFVWCFFCDSLIWALFVGSFGFVLDLPLDIASVLTSEYTLLASALHMDMPKELE